MIFTVTQTQDDPKKTWLIKNLKGYYGVCYLNKKQRHSIEIEIPESNESWSVLSSDGEFKHNYVATIHDKSLKSTGMISGRENMATNITYKNANYIMYEVYINPKETWLCLYDEDMQLAATKLETSKKPQKFEIFCLDKKDLKFILPAVLRYTQIRENRNFFQRLFAKTTKSKFSSKHDLSFIKLVTTVG